MPIFILVISLVLVSCKTENQVQGRPVFVAPLENKTAEAEKKIDQQEELPTVPEKVLAHEKGESVLRDKLLALLINEHLKKKSEKTSLVELSLKDELQLKNKSHNPTEAEIKDYESRAKEAFRVVVSYPDHLLVYFVPANLPLGKLQDKLGIKEGPQQKLTWVGARATTTQKGEAVYLLSTNKEEVLAYDKHHSIEIVPMGQLSDAIHLRLKKKQIATAIINYEFYKQSTYMKEFNAPRVRCWQKHCSFCTYVRETEGTVFLKVPAPTLEEIGLSVSHDGARYPLSLFSPKISAPDQIELSLKDVAMSEASKYDLVISLSTQPEVREMEFGKFGYQCGEDKAPFSHTGTLQTKAQASLTLRLQGNGDLLDDLKL